MYLICDWKGVTDNADREIVVSESELFSLRYRIQLVNVNNLREINIIDVT